MPSLKSFIRNDARAALERIAEEEKQREEVVREYVISLQPRRVELTPLHFVVGFVLCGSALLYLWMFITAMFTMSGLR